VTSCPRRIYRTGKEGEGEEEGEGEKESEGEEEGELAAAVAAVAAECRGEVSLFPD
jgi:hypothetical protein